MIPLAATFIGFSTRAYEAATSGTVPNSFITALSSVIGELSFELRVMGLLEMLM